MSAGSAAGVGWLKPPAPAVVASGQGWRAPLTPDQVPPRPPDALPNAVPPTYPGDTWFWINRATEVNSGWAPRPDDSTNGFAIAEPPPQQTSTLKHFGTTGTENASGPGPYPALGVDCPPDSESPAPWPRLVDGILVPEPGSGGIVEGLDPIDPNSTDPAVKDVRTHGQKLLDGMIDCIKLAARTGKLPLNGGLKPQLFISTTQADLDRHNLNRTMTAKSSIFGPDGGSRPGGGIVQTPYSGPQPLAAFEESICDAETTRFTVDNNNKILNLGRSKRLFTTAQRKVLVARDMGCSFPDCTAPPYWTEAHHIISWLAGGETSIINGVLGCGLHHHLLHHSDWTVRLVNGIPFYTPPYKIDPTGRERRNTYHLGLSRK